MDIYLVATLLGDEGVALILFGRLPGACAGPGQRPTHLYIPQHAQPTQHPSFRPLVYSLSSSVSLLFRIISPLQSGTMREEEHLVARPPPPPPLDIIRNSSGIGPQSFIQFSDRPDLHFYRSIGKSSSFSSS